MKILFFILFIISFNLSAKVTDFLCSYKLTDHEGGDGRPKEIQVTYHYDDRPDIDKYTSLKQKGGFEHSCHVEIDVIKCWYLESYVIRERSHFNQSRILISRLNLSAAYLVSRSSSNANVKGKFKEYNYDSKAFNEALESVSTKRTYEGTCEIIEAKDLRF